MLGRGGDSDGAGSENQRAHPVPLPGLGSVTMRRTCVSPGSQKLGRKIEFS